MGFPCGGGRVGERGRGWDQERWLQALLLGARLLLPCLQHPDQVLEAGFTSPHAPLGFVLPCVLILLVFPNRAAVLLLTVSASPGADRCWSALVLPVPRPKPSPPAQTWDPLPWNCLSSTLPSTLFCLKHFNVVGQQLRGCPDPFLEALSTF